MSLLDFQSLRILFDNTFPKQLKISFLDNDLSIVVLFNIITYRILNIEFN